MTLGQAKARAFVALNEVYKSLYGDDTGPPSDEVVDAIGAEIEAAFTAGLKQGHIEEKREAKKWAT